MRTERWETEERVKLNKRRVCPGRSYRRRCAHRQRVGWKDLRRCGESKAQPFLLFLPPPSSEPEAQAHIVTLSCFLLSSSPPALWLHFTGWSPTQIHDSPALGMVQKNSTLCPSDNQQLIDQTGFWSSDGIDWDAHRIGWLIAGVCAAVVRSSCVVTQLVELTRGVVDCRPHNHQCRLP